MRKKKKMIKDLMSIYFLSQTTATLSNKKHVLFTSLEAVIFSKIL